MRLLIDTNVFLEIILQQDKAEQAKTLLERTENHEFFISDYSLHSIGVLLFRRRQHDIFQEFLDDMTLNAGMTVISVFAHEMRAIIEVAQKFNLDFDDAYQYVAAEKNDLNIVSFDSDFDRTERGRKTPAEIQSV
ncbi:MAG: PIN domain-containing protein [Candidatus Binatia bacterium]